MRELKFEYVVKSGDAIKISKPYTLGDIEELGFLDELLEGLDECVMMCHSDNNCDCDTPFYSEGEIIAKRQYVEIKDSTGVEVYEGDIVKVWDDYICKLKGRVEYNEDGGRYRITNGRGYDTRNCIDLDCDLEIEVVGNIYESPELLEVA